MRPYSTSRGDRRGTVTVIVVAFLGLFFVLALTFVFYSIAESDNSKAYRDAAAGYDMVDLGGPDPYPIMNHALGSLIFGPEDGLAGAHNALRGHDLSRTIYGYNQFDPTGGTQAFNGYGRVPPPTLYPFLPASVANMVNFTWQPAMFNRMLLEADSNFYRDPELIPGQPGYQNPPPPPGWTYRYYAKNANYTYPDLNNFYLAAMDAKTGRMLAMSFHRRDLLIDSSTGNEAIVPPNPPLATTPITGLVPGGDPASPNPWLNQTGKLLMLRPRPVDNQHVAGQSMFRYPTMNGDGTYGDVINIDNKPGAASPYYDAVWMDLDLPVSQWQGKNYKPLVAMTILDLNSRIDVNTAGNFYPLPDSMQPAPPASPLYAHWSNQGLGPWEVNPAMVMGNNVNAAADLSRPRLAWRQAGDPPGPPNWKTAYPLQHNRFGGSGYNAQGFFGKGAPERKFRVYPNENIFVNQPSPGTGAHFFAPVDFDGRWSDPAAPKYGQGQGRQTHLVFGPAYQGQPGQQNDPPRPHSSSRYGNGLFIPGYYDERTDHLSMYNPYWVRPDKQSNPAAAPDRIFGVEELRYLNEKYNFAPTEQFVGSDLAALTGAGSLGNPNFPANTLNQRFAITTLSNELHSPGASPWLSGPAGNTYTYDPTTSRYPTGSVQSLNVADGNQPAPTGSGDHDQFYRAKLAQLGPVDLNRKLTDYRLVASQPLSPTNLGNAARAVLDRQQFAMDIFRRLLYVTTGDQQALNMTAAPTITAGIGTPQYHAVRWLAQLAVNIVDYIDADELMTPFNWNNAQATSVQNGWVYGFERSKLVMNETYVRYENDPADMGAPSGDMNYPQNKKATIPYSMRAWIELHNPMTPNNPAEQNMDPMGDNGTHGGYRTRLEEQVLQNPSDPMSAKPQSAYRILVYRIPTNMAGQDPAKMRDPDNVLGLPKLSAMPPQPPGWPKIVDFSDTAKVKSAPNGKTIQPNVGAQINGQSFYLLGPDHDAPGMANDAQLPGTNKNADLTHTELRFPIAETELDSMNADTTLKNRPTWVPMFVLQRLANPYAIYAGPSDPAQPPADPRNPYITVDYLEPDVSGKSVYDRVTHRFDYLRGPDSPAPEDKQPDLNTTFAWGRRQPYDARIDYANDQAPPSNKYRQGSNAMPGMGSIGGHTFGAHNAKNGTWPAPASAGNYATTWESPGSQTDDTLQVPFLPLHHIDRILVSPAELLHVVAVKPHELTHAYYMAQTGASATDRRLAYTANWLDSPDTSIQANRSTFLFRALDFLRTPSWIEGVPFGGRVPGKVNLNTVFNDMTGGIAAAQFQAVTDPTAANRFTSTEVNNAWAQLVGPTGRNPSAGQVTIQDKPFRGLATAVEAAGAASGSNSQDRTFARNGALWANNMNDEAFVGNNTDVGAVKKYELLGKTMNQLTTRSNCFAVWMTIGYFEVMNTGPYDENNRPILGAEIGSDTGNVVRHKFFSVIDRTNLTIEPPSGPGQPQKQGQAPAYLEYHPHVPLPDQSNGYALSPDPNLTTQTQVVVRIPAISFTPAKSPPAPQGGIASISGYYDGRVWTIMDDPTLPGIETYAQLGSGATQERVRIRTVPNGFDAITKTATVVLVKPGGGNFTYQHHRGEALRLEAPDPLQAGATPGSPGPQPGFQYNAPRYAPVVRYVEQLK